MTRVPTIRVRVPPEGDAPHRGTLSIGEWSIPCTIGAGGLVQASLKREGDKRSPIGVFPLRYGFFDSTAFPDMPRDLRFPFVPLSSDMIWEEEGGHYNRLVFAEGTERADERLQRTRRERLFDVIIPIGFNDSVVESGRGSALFIHAASSDGSGTAGCVGIPREHLVEFLRRLEPGMLIDIGSAQPDEPVRVNEEDGPLESVRFSGLRSGPKLIVIGAVHGNEPCGPNAILRAISDCRAGSLSIRRGEVTFVPVANLKAYRQRTREGDRNLNRDLRERTLAEVYEDRIGNRICSLLREHDVLLDLHSFKSRGEPFVFAGPSDNSGDVEPFRHAQAEAAFAARLGVPVVMHGWLNVYDRFVKEKARLGFKSVISEGVGTTEFMRFSGGYGVTLECGEHDDPHAAEVGYNAIVNALAHLGLIEAPAPQASVKRAIQIVDYFLCENDGDRLEGPWNTGAAISAGEIIVRRANGKTVVAPEAGFIVFPNTNAKPGDGLCYFGVESPRAFGAE
ncbi:L,D-transpeptidase family protein [Microvirga alba]|uniref:Succinylglutamate desuccinylase/aspartoacylase family protein n=1 Tax=Microvirga alba TaxID=2791025 RepID=A0A931FP27_9HYPH|nr:succinylglutamate desuccinylase/aspartoacylase family protein [Microvirga alba]MBF9234589.1 succinylglutamate desuccinylase/aspartoacylase family protein [Microvirga alba]